MFISVLDLFKIGIGPSSSHTMGPMVAAQNFITLAKKYFLTTQPATQLHKNLSLCCTLKGSLSLTGKGHASDRAIALGLHGYLPEDIANENLETVVKRIWNTSSISIDKNHSALFFPEKILFSIKAWHLPSIQMELFLN